MEKVEPFLTTPRADVKTCTNFGSFVFVHIPRCAGTSFREYLHTATSLSEICAARVFTPGYGYYSATKNLHQLEREEFELVRAKRILVLASHDYFGSQEFSALALSTPYLFTFLRRPLDRFWSHYHFFYYAHGLEGLKGRALEDLTDHQLELMLLSFSNLQVRYLSGLNHHALDESDLESAKTNLKCRFSSFGLAEQIEVSIQWLRTTAPKWLNLKASFPHVNSCPELHSKLPNNSLRSEIEKANSLDLELYAFASELFELRTRRLNEETRAPDQPT